jgi:manganese/zinc/iron transport system permease protein
MGSLEIQILLIACMVASACALPGVFLVLRRQALMSDAISHSILFGIVVAFFITKDLASPWLILGATMTGILTVTLTELIIHTRLLKEDSAIGLIFPVFFATGVLLINRYAGQVHLDNDSVLLGEILHAPNYRLIISGVDLGPRAMWMMGGILLANALLMLFFYKELKIATFDPGLATALGFSPTIIHYGLMTMVSITAVGAFDAVGSILVVALMITPPATAYMLTNRLNRMILLSLLIGIVSAGTGCLMAFALDFISIAGAMATSSGVFFLAAFIFSPSQGLLLKWMRQRKQKWKFACHMLAIHLLDHEGTPQEEEENAVSMLTGPHMRWSEHFAARVVALSVSHGLIRREGERLFLTPLGRETARAVMAH